MSEKQDAKFRRTTFLNTVIVSAFLLIFVRFVCFVF